MPTDRRGGGAPCDTPRPMGWTPLELSAVVMGASLAAVGTVGAWEVVRQRRKGRALNEALAATEAVTAALTEEALFLSAVLESVDTGIVMNDASGRVRLVNARFEELTGLRGSELIGRPHAFLVDAVAEGFADPEAYRAASSRDETAERAPSSIRVPGEAAPDEVELVRTTPRRRVLLYAVVPVLQGTQRVGDLEIFRDVTAQRDAEEAQRKLMVQLEARATTDALTGLKNRRAATEALQHELVRAQRYDRSLAVVLFDVDHFKKVNDELGHDVGDRVLSAFGHVLGSCARGTDVVARWGGEEFLVLLPETDEAGARTFGDRVRAALAQARPLEERPVTCSAGVAVRREGDTQDALVKRADERLYEAKRAGRDRVG